MISYFCIKMHLVRPPSDHGVLVVIRSPKIARQVVVVHDVNYTRSVAKIRKCHNVLCNSRNASFRCETSCSGGVTHIARKLEDASTFSAARAMEDFEIEIELSN